MYLLAMMREGNGYREQKDLVMIHNHPIGKSGWITVFIPFIGKQNTQILSKEALKRRMQFANMFHSSYF